MQQTLLSRQSRSSSLPKLLPNSTSKQLKLFQNNEQLAQTKKIFLQRIEMKQQPKTNIDENQRTLVVNKSFIQFPKHSIQDGFTSFKSINKSQTNEMFQQLRNMRSKSTLLQPFIKAQILLNKAAHQKIRILNQIKLKQERDYVARRIKQLTPAKMNKEVKVKDNNKKKIKNVKKIILQMNFKVYQQNLQCWKPYVDFDSMAVPIKQQIFFIGGRKQCPIVVFNVIQSRWKQLPAISEMKCFGETDPSVLQNNKIMCFGGYDYFQQGFSLITNALKTINLKQKTIQIQQFPQTKTPCRAFHSQCTYGQFLIISGGIDKNSKLFNNFMNFNFEKKYWNQLTIQKMPQRLKLGFAKHQTMSIFHSRNNYSIYDNQPIVSLDQNLKQQGIYIFGGQDSNADLMATMYIMKLGQPAIVIEQLQISGTAPIPRRNARMLRLKQYIVIHGGRNDEMKPSVLNSMHFLNLKTLNWIKVGGQKPPYRYSHALTVVHNEIVILGGKGLQGLSKQVFIMPYQQIVQYI